MKILNFGSLNIDNVYTVEEFVRPGETVTAKSHTVFAGGKGLNQSIAAARAGAEVIHGGAIGPDGGFLAALLEDAGADAGHLLRLDIPTGHTVIEVDAGGQNRILVWGGANHGLTHAYLEDVFACGSDGDIVLLQNETSLTDSIIRRAHGLGFRVVFNPSRRIPMRCRLMMWICLSSMKARRRFSQTPPPALHRQPCSSTCISGSPRRILS